MSKDKKARFFAEDGSFPCVDKSFSSARDCQENLKDLFDLFDKAIQCRKIDLLI